VPGPNSRLFRALLAPAAFLAASLALTSAASAATYTVNDPTDAALASPSNTACVSTHGGTCTLRAAVQAADNAGGSDAITVPAGEFKLTIPSATTEDPSTGDLDIKEGVSVTLTGAGPSSTILNANHVDREFTVQKGAVLIVSGVKIENGAQPDTSPSDNSSFPAYGGAVYNNATFSISNCVLEGNSADDGGGAIKAGAEAAATTVTNCTGAHNPADDEGGFAYMESGSLTLTGDMIEHNSADSDGGAVYVDESGHTVAPITVTNTTIKHNTADSDGGGIYMDIGGNLSVTNSRIESNNTDDDEGGGIYDYEGGTITIENSSVSNNNSGDDSGAGLYAERDGQATVTNSTFANNDSGDDDGGAIYTDDTSLNVTGSMFVNNSGCCGGALYIDAPSSTSVDKITTTSFIENHAASDEGGAIYDDFGDLEIEKSTFANNSSSYYGGAIYYDSGDGLQLTNTTFDGNQGIEGGALYMGTTASTGSVNLLNDTLTRNTAYEGGGIYEPERANAIENTIVAGNFGGFTSSGGGDCYFKEAASAETADKGGNIDSDGTCFSDSVAGDDTGVNPGLATLANNGGPTETDELLAGSPAIGRGISVFCPATDQRGAPRPAPCDSGAYQTETGPTITIAAPVNGATVTQGQVVNASYTCTAPAGASITACTGTVASGAPINTSTLGAHTFMVTASDSSFASSTKSVTYTVVAASGKPTVSNLKQSHKKWRLGSSLPEISKKKPPVGTVFSFSLNESASVTLAFVRHAHGRKVHGSCVAQTKKNKKKKRCVRDVTAGNMTFAGHAGANKVAFDGVISSFRTLSPGSYTVLVTASAGGKHSATKSLNFTIAK